MQRDYEKLNKEHAELATQMVILKAEDEGRAEENEELKGQVEALKGALNMTESANSLKPEVEELFQRNIKLTAVNLQLEDTITLLQNSYAQVQIKLDECMKENKRLEELLLKSTSSADNNSN